ncbi:MAG: hypothetical protein ACLP9L_08965 [Thermoguttaceae bacterium]
MKISMLSWVIILTLAFLGSRTVAAEPAGAPIPEKPAPSPQKPAEVPRSEIPPAGLSYTGRVT